MWQIIAPPTTRYSDHFLYASIILRANPRIRYLEFGGCPLFRCCNCIIIYGDTSWYIEQCPLFGRRPLLGVSVNRESTVHVPRTVTYLSYTNKHIGAWLVPLSSMVQANLPSPRYFKACASRSLSECGEVFSCHFLSICMFICHKDCLDST